MIERLPRSSLLALSLALIAGVSTAQVTHREHYLGWANGAVTNTALDGRLSQAAMQYRSYAPVPRIAFYDIAFPKDCAEFATMSGHAVLVVTAVVQDSAELPPARIYLGSGPAGTDLLRIGGVQSCGHSYGGSIQTCPGPLCPHRRDSSVTPLSNKRSVRRQN